MSSVLTDTFLGDIALDRIEYLTVVQSNAVTIYTHNQTNSTSNGKSVVERPCIGSVYAVLSSTKLVKRDGVWCSVERPVGCLALMVVVSE